MPLLTEDGELSSASALVRHTTDQHLNDDVGYGDGENEAEDLVIHVVSFQVSL